MHSRRWILILAVSVLVSASSTRAQDPCDAKTQSKDAFGGYTIWTGPAGGYYDKVGQALRYAAAHRQLKLAAVTSNGSVQNICALVQGKADFALVQSDAAHLAWYGEQPFRKKYYPALQLVTPLFVEKVHVLTRPHLYVASPAGLTRPHSVWMGPDKSGSELSAELVLRASGKNQEDIVALKATPPPADFGEAVNRLKAWELDAIFQTEIAPAKDIAEQLNDLTSEIRLLGFDWSSVELLTKNGMYIETSLQNVEYPQLSGGIYTVGVEALLLTRNNVNREAVTQLADILEDHGKDVFTHLQRIIAYNAGLTVDPGGETRLSRAESRKLIEPQTLSLLGTRVPGLLFARAHPQAKGYLWTWRVPREATIRILELIAFLFIICGGLLHPNLRRRAGKKMRFLLFLTAYTVVLVIGGTWLQGIEGGLNQRFTTLLASCVSLAENVLAKLQIPISPLPTPTSSYGGNVMKWFSWILFGLFTAHIYPALKKVVPFVWNTKFWQTMVGSR